MDRKWLLIGLIAALAGCDARQAVGNGQAYENGADALDNQAADLDARADNLAAAAERAAQNAAAEMRAKADADYAAGAGGNAAAQNGN